MLVDTIRHRTDTSKELRQTLDCLLDVTKELRSYAYEFYSINKHENKKEAEIIYGETKRILKELKFMYRKILPSIEGSDFFSLMGNYETHIPGVSEDELNLHELHTIVRYKTNPLINHNIINKGTIVAGFTRALMRKLTAEGLDFKIDHYLSKGISEQLKRMEVCTRETLNPDKRIERLSNQLRIQFTENQVPHQKDYSQYQIQ